MSQVKIPQNYNGATFQTPVQIPMKIPPTPGPKSIEDIQNDAKDRFAGIMLITQDQELDPNKYFIEYDHWENYSETKQYSKRPYQQAYKGLIKNYQNLLYIYNNDNESKYYVVAKHIKGELEELEPYCVCVTCSSSIINPLKYIWCPLCTGCIKAGSAAKKEYINRAKQLKEADEQRQKYPSKYNKYLKEIRWIRITEITTIIVVIVSILWILLI